MRSDRNAIKTAWLEIMGESLRAMKAPMPEELKQLLEKPEQKEEKTPLEEDRKE